MRAIYIRDEISRVLKQNELEPFALWAFGPSYATLTGQQLLLEWNTRHDHRLMIDSNRDAKESVRLMVGAWLFEEEKKRVKPWFMTEVRWSEVINGMD